MDRKQWRENKKRNHKRNERRRGFLRFMKNNPRLRDALIDEYKALKTWCSWPG